MSTLTIALLLLTLSFFQCDAEDTSSYTLPDGASITANPQYTIHPIEGSEPEFGDTFQRRAQIRQKPSETEDSTNSVAEVWIYSRTFPKPDSDAEKSPTEYELFKNTKNGRMDELRKAVPEPDRNTQEITETWIDFNGRNAHVFTAVSGSTKTRLQLITVYAKNSLVSFLYFGPHREPEDWIQEYIEAIHTPSALKAYEAEVRKRIGNSWEKMTRINLQPGGIGRVGFSITIAPSGQIINCETTELDGSKSLESLSRMAIKQTELPPPPNNTDFEISLRFIVY